MKIGIDIRAVGRQRTGDEVYTLNLVQNLAKIDRDNQYFLFTDTNDEQDLKAIKDKLGFSKDKEGDNFRVVPILPDSKISWTLWSLPRWVAKNPLDILHVQYITPQWFLPSETSLVTTVHDVSFKRLPQYIAKKDLFLLNLFIPRSLARADQIIAVSHFTKTETVACYQVKSRKVTVVYNGSAGKDFFKEFTKEQEEEIKKKYQLPDKFIFYVGTHQPRKNLPFLLKGFVRLKKDYAGDPLVGELALVIGGKRGGKNADPRIEKTLEEITESDPEIFKQIIFPGYISNEDLPAIFSLSRGFVFPSYYEGFGLPLIEAMVRRVPVACSKNPCFREIAKRAALFFAEDSLSSFSRTVHQLISDEDCRKRLKKEGAERARDFSWEKCARETLEVYQETNKKKVRKKR